MSPIRYQPVKGEEVLISPAFGRCRAGRVVLTDYPEHGGRLTYPRIVVQVDGAGMVELTSEMASAFWWARDRRVFGSMRVELEPMDDE